MVLQCHEDQLVLAVLVLVLILTEIHGTWSCFLFFFILPSNIAHQIFGWIWRQGRKINSKISLLIFTVNFFRYYTLECRQDLPVIFNTAWSLWGALLFKHRKSLEPDKHCISLIHAWELTEHTTNKWYTFL